jgi:hypothetical protein
MANLLLAALAQLPPTAPPPPEAPPLPITCDDTCRWANDGVCDDGGLNARFAVCPYGSDCADCGQRVGYAPPAPPPVSGVCTETLFDDYCGAFRQKKQATWVDGYSCRGTVCRPQEICCAANFADCCETNSSAIIGVAVGGAFGLLTCCIAFCYCPCCASPRRSAGRAAAHFGLPIAAGRPVPTAMPVTVTGTRPDGVVSRRPFDPTLSQTAPPFALHTSAH